MKQQSIITDMSQSNESERMRAQNMLLSLHRERNAMKAEAVRAALDIVGFLKGLEGIVEDSKECKIEDIPRLKIQSDIYLALLKKGLPDMKAVEVTQKGNLQIIMAPDEHDL